DHSAETTRIIHLSCSIQYSESCVLSSFTESLSGIDTDYTTIVFYSIFGVVCVLFYRIIKPNQHGLDMHYDENIARYLKLERKLKLDGYKIRLMFEIIQWRRKCSGGKEKLPRSRIISNENYDTERDLVALEKRLQLHLCPNIEHNEFSDFSNLEIAD
ncbi:hypothetical protein CHS0354_037588, partial [Potamilus streckersoni]